MKTIKEIGALNWRWRSNIHILTPGWGTNNYNALRCIHTNAVNHVNRVAFDFVPWGVTVWLIADLIQNVWFVTISGSNPFEERKGSFLVEIWVGIWKNMPVYDHIHIQLYGSFNTRSQTGKHLLSCSVIADAVAAIFCCVHGKADCVDIELITKFAKCIDIYILRIPSQIVCTYTLNLEDRLIFVHYKSRWWDT